MKKFKICPYCGKYNLPAALECEECETDISTVRVMDEEIVKLRNEKEVSQPTLSSVEAKVRICEECGYRNPANARKCQSCGEDISDIVPTDNDTEGKSHCVLTSLDGVYAYSISEGETIIGREAAMSEYLSNKGYVSRQHAKLTLTNREIIIENKSKTNFTYVNNEKLMEGSRKLKDGDEIGLGGNEHNGKRQSDAAYFIMRINSCI